MRAALKYWISLEHLNRELWRQLVSSNSFLSLGLFCLFFLRNLCHACIAATGSLCASSWVHILESLQFEFFLWLLWCSHCKFAFHSLISMNLGICHPDSRETSVRGLLSIESAQKFEFLTICLQAAYLFWSCDTDSSPKSFLIIPSTGVCGLLALPNEKSSPGSLLTFGLTTGTILASFTFLKALFAYLKNHFNLKRLEDLAFQSCTILTFASDAFSFRHILLSFMKSLGSAAFFPDLSWYIQCWVTTKFKQVLQLRSPDFGLKVMIFKKW